MTDDRLGAMRGLEGTESVRLRPHAFHIALLAVFVLVAAGCAAFRGPGSSLTPSDGPTSTTTPARTATPTPTRATPITHRTEAADVILRMEWGGGLVPMEFFVTQAPQFTLYGDGTVVFKPLPDGVASTVGKPYPPFLTGKMPEVEVQELLSFALSDGGLGAAKDAYDYPRIADASTTVFDVDADGIHKRVSVYALTEAQADRPDQADRNALSALAQRLNKFETEARAGAVDSVVEYDPDTYRVVMFEQLGQGLAENVRVIEWPWPDLEPADFSKADGRGAERLMTRDEVAKLTSVPNGGQQGIWVMTPAGGNVEFVVRPLLPNEVPAPEGTEAPASS